MARTKQTARPTYSNRYYGTSDHCCGFYYLTPSDGGWATRSYLPQLNVKAYTHIISSTSRTVLTQEFANPKDNAIDEIRYTFPLFDGVSVVGFTCHVNDRVIRGVVKEKARARKDYKDAVERGETAGLFEQLPDAADVFTTTVGNVPAGAHINVEITYLGELKHDAEVDGIRFTIPTSIAPRYGSTEFPLAPGAENITAKSGIEITVDATVAEGTYIKSIRSPSHPIVVNMGTTSHDLDAAPQHHIASASLSLGSAELDKDFVLQVVAKETGTPRAILERHPTLPGYRALMTTLVPKFSLPSERPEVVFVVDRSGSMAGGKIKKTADALRVFVKSLPVGVKFNICSFGDRCSFLFDKSKAYSQDSLDQAIKHLEVFSANYGGTEMLAPIKETVQRRYKDLSLEILLLTDGEIWDQDSLFRFLNEQISEQKQPIRVFTLGIGDDVSHSLIEGVARAGNGFCQAVGLEEKLDGKVVRMLKGALSPHVTDYTLEVKYEDVEKDVGDEEFEIVERVADSLHVRLDELMLDKAEKPAAESKAISLFDDTMDLDKDDPKPEDDPSGQSRFSHLPILETPKLLQAPSIIPPLFPFNRTTVYLLMSPSACQKVPKAVVLRGTSKHGPLELEIPISVLNEPGESIHQLACKKAVKELEEGRGWLSVAKHQDSGKALKEHYESRYDEMIEREAVRLGVQFQIGGKWCSFVALEENDEDDECEPKDTRSHATPRDRDHEQTQLAPALQSMHFMIPQAILEQYQRDMSSSACMSLPDEDDADLDVLAGPSTTQHTPQTTPSYPPSGCMAPRMALASRAARKAASSREPAFSIVNRQSKRVRGAFLAEVEDPDSCDLEAMCEVEEPNNSPVVEQAQYSRSPSSFSRSYSSISPFCARSFTPSSYVASDAEQAPLSSFASLDYGSQVSSSVPPPPPTRERTANYLAQLSSYETPAAHNQAPPPPPHQTPETILAALIAHQTYTGSFTPSPALFELLGTTDAAIKHGAQKAGLDGEDIAVFVTMVVVLFCERRLADLEESWELVVEKARGWVGERVGGREKGRMGEIEGVAAGFVSVSG
ncbi:hypothetical protein EJ05DRAFT_470357 [Pseudovirgaria hyperparasitica]|uniref:VIT-domain-containing protein n=1 Tax=Pseudovirgaria hyperparasitica TaxID=470096 RepID=A0A6A6VWB3_9PEZI|nr:uncharacterized protein EJ05DRAFT_470357 [Pseudovirgaria hyperparasitica]KAF2753537.1 hypothetical protein EJ05DRAFT_470357 [Pseudovirgaria hyperparasitica]